MRGHRGGHGVEAKAIATAARPTRREEALEVLGGHALAVVLDVDRDLIREALHGGRPALIRQQWLRSWHHS